MRPRRVLNSTTTRQTLSLWPPLKPQRRLANDWLTVRVSRLSYTARGNAEPETAADDKVAAALIRASDYIQAHYVARFSDQDTSQPEVVQAVYITAGYELDKPGFFSKTFTPSEQKVLTEVNGIKWTPVGNASGPESAAPRSTVIEALLTPFLNVSVGVLVV